MENVTHLNPHQAPGFKPDRHGGQVGLPDSYVAVMGWGASDKTPCPSNPYGVKAVADGKLSVQVFQVLMNCPRRALQPMGDGVGGEPCGCKSENTEFAGG